MKKEKKHLWEVMKNGCAIRFIKNPSEAVQLKAVTTTFYAIRYIQQPSEAVQLAAVRSNKLAIFYIQNPCEAAIKEVTGS